MERTKYEITTLLLTYKILVSAGIARFGRMLETTRIQGDELYADKWGRLKDFGTGLFNTLEFHAQYEPTGRCLMVVQRDDYTRKEKKKGTSDAPERPLDSIPTTVTTSAGQSSNIGAPNIAETNTNVIKSESKNDITGEAGPGSEPRVHERVRRSNTEKWLAQAALILNLTKSAADAAGLAPLKGACEGAVTVLEVIQAFNNGRSAWNELAKTIQMQIGAFNAQLNQPGINDVVDDSVKGPIANYIATLKELLADVCEDADINKTNFENKEGLLKMFVKRSGTSKLETDIISTYEKRLKAAESKYSYLIPTFFFAQYSGLE
ncbi:SubName: Full=Uncharacterized protein {ECO:0000313/EMBL:CCA76751.1} [Serendipita indica DSM 11827]|nr:SubName: Full=Uncharacterized protein {ECO:0000313/EMBL:CCA76751.1} [Serendipita indica DSM 11827]